MKNNIKQLKQRGFTLIEIMVVVVILGILAAAVVPKIMSRPEQARIEKAKHDVMAFESALDIYKLDNYQYPSTDQGLEALVTKPSGSPQPRNYKNGGYIKKLNKDPWGKDYLYLSPGTHGELDIYSLGPDGQQSDDDIGNWSVE
ncbi:MAG: type II secretion system major pseudopilin GspG [Gammaproteobacteria bacterium]|nr:type II secretion system major pseudopilin GspG [Gammaproteobacteria bacterium]MCW8988641.1 type II secretion system major pseudopilin GspG [Gammaproteobacteria bacterium]MCW9030493.1 type II secretion system major pseudopilin GspG [Gammaproteobacteria bacterium]